MPVYKKSNMPTSIIRALTGRIEDVIMGYPLDSAKGALEAVLTLVAAQTPVAPVIVPTTALDDAIVTVTSANWGGSNA